LSTIDRSTSCGKNRQLVRDVRQFKAAAPSRAGTDALGVSLAREARPDLVLLRDQARGG
jgi:hypothetical protein